MTLATAPAPAPSPLVAAVHRRGPYPGSQPRPLLAQMLCTNLHQHNYSVVSSSMSGFASGFRRSRRLASGRRLYASISWALTGAGDRVRPVLDRDPPVGDGDRAHPHGVAHTGHPLHATTGAAAPQGWGRWWTWAGGGRGPVVDVGGWWAGAAGGPAPARSLSLFASARCAGVSSRRAAPPGRSPRVPRSPGPRWAGGP